jgi:hypothetical protein
MYAAKSASNCAVGHALTVTLPANGVVGAQCDPMGLARILEVFDAARKTHLGTTPAAQHSRNDFEGGGSADALCKHTT